MTVIEHIQSELQSKSSPEKAKASSWFFKTGKGQYGEGDKFIGVTLPEQRTIAKKYYKEITPEEIAVLLNSAIHEYRLTALIMMVYKFERENEEKVRGKIYSYYLKNIDRVNNWDLVDTSAHKIIGAFLDGKDKSLLRIFARSNNMWHRRIAVISTFHAIGKGDATDALRIAEMLVHDPEDIVQKAVGWMLREVGKRVSVKEEKEFLDVYASNMPRVMLRYAIEHFDKPTRGKYLSMKQKRS